MRTSVRFSLVVSLLGASVACSSSGLLDSSPQSDMAPGAGAPGTAATSAACNACVNASCPWETTECSGDPGCAKWMQCVLAQAAAGRTDLSSCTAPTSTAGKSARARAETCLRSSVTTCCARAGGGAATGTELDAGESPTPGTSGYAGAGGGAVWDGDGSKNSGGDAAETPIAMASGEACYSCLSSCCRPTSAAGCSAFIHPWKYCLLTNTDKDANAANAQETLEKCAFGMIVKEGTADEYAALVGDGAALCLTGLASLDDGGTGGCLEQCVPSSYRSCVDCQKASCYDELYAFLTDGKAQELLMCKRSCAGTQGCDCSAYADGAQALQAIAKCTSSFCSTSCPAM